MMLDDDHTALLPSRAVRAELRAIYAADPRLARLADSVSGPVAQANSTELRNVAGARLYQMVRIPVQGVPGRLFVGPCPGYGTDSEARLDALRDWGVDRVICLVPSMDLGPLLGAPFYERDASERWGERFHLLGIVDYEAPGDDAPFERLVDDTVAALVGGETVLAHCALGCGRAGMFLSCVLVARGEDPVEAARIFRQIRRCGPESGDQLAYIVRYAQRAGARALAPLS